MSSELLASPGSSASSLARPAALFSERTLVVLALAVAALAALRLGLLSHGLRVVCFDDGIARDGWNDPAIASANLDLDYSTGRFYAHWKFAVLGWLQAGVPALAQTLVRVGALLFGAAGAAWFGARWLGSRTDALLGGTLFLAVFPFYEGYQAFFSTPLLFVGLGAVCASAALLGYPGPRARAASLVLLAVALVCHELFALFLVLHFAQTLRLTGGPALAVVRRLAPEAAILAAYVALNFTLRSVAEGEYAGVHLSLAPAAAAQSLVRYTLASLPGIELWLDRTATGSLPLRPAGAAVSLLVRHLDLLSLVLGLSTALLAYRHLTAPDSSRIAAAPIGYALLLFAFLVALPNVLPALTSKYQVWAMQRRLPYYYGALGLVFGACGLVLIGRSIRGAPRTVAVLAAAALGCVVLATQAMNVEVALRLARQPIDLAPLSP